MLRSIIPMEETKMPETRGTEEKKVLVVRLTELMARKERDRFMEAIEKEIAKSGQISLLLELDEPRANDPGALIEDLNWIKIHADNIKRAAVVGQQAWEDTWVAIARLFARVEVRYFDRQQIVEARSWLSE